MTEPKHPGQKPEFKLLKPTEATFTIKGSEKTFTGRKILIPEGATHISIDDEERGEFSISFLVENKPYKYHNHAMDTATFYAELDNHRKELAKWEEGMAVWNIYQKEMHIERLRGEIEGLKKNSLTTEQKEVD